MQVVNSLSVTYLQLFLACPDVPLKQMVLLWKTIAEVDAHPQGIKGLITGM